MLIKKSLQYEVFPGGQPSRYYPRPTGFDFGDRTSPGFFPCFFFISKRPESGACQCNNITNFPFFANYNNTFGKYNIATKIFYITLFLQDMKICTCILYLYFILMDATRLWVLFHAIYLDKLF